MRKADAQSSRELCCRRKESNWAEVLIGNSDMPVRRKNSSRAILDRTTSRISRCDGHDDGLGSAADHRFGSEGQSLLPKCRTRCHPASPRNEPNTHSFPSTHGYTERAYPNRESGSPGRVHSGSDRFHRGSAVILQVAKNGAATLCSKIKGKKFHDRIPDKRIR